LESTTVDIEMGGGFGSGAIGCSIESCGDAGPQEPEGEGELRDAHNPVYREEGILVCVIACIVMTFMGWLIF
jgi:hypothetical protein